MNGDGRNDIVTSHAGGGLYWLENSATGWVPHAITTGGAIYEIAVADLDLDGDLDIASVSARGTGWPGSCCGGEVRAYWNDGTGKFTSTQISTVVVGGRGVKCGDLDGDGRPEIIWTYREFGSRSVHFARNQGGGTFGGAQVIGYVPEAHDVELSDVDQDGDLDVLVVGYRASAPTLFLNQWPTWTARGLPGSESGAIFLWVADLDGDGDEDVITRSILSGGSASWRENKGGGSFGATTRIFQGSSYGCGAVLDLDLDGDVDFVGNDSNSQLVWWENVAGSLAAGASLGVAGSGVSIAGDLDSDGDEDLIFDVGGAVTVVMNLMKSGVPASYSNFGAGCASSTLPPAISATTLPKIGKAFTLRVSNLAPSSPGVLLFGVSDTMWSGVQLPMDLAFLGMKGCNLLVSWDLDVGFFVRTGSTWDLPINIPNTPSLQGTGFYNQAWVLDAKANAFGVGTSNGGKGVIGY